MSAFIVGDAHINAMLQDTAPRFQGDSAGYYWNGEMHYINGNRQAVGQILLAENYRSVNYRYDEREQTPTFQPVCPSRQYSPIEIIKACDCYGYQACKAPDWKDTEAYAVMQALRNRAIQRLPEYREADWVIP